MSNPTPEPLPRPERTSVAPGIQRARRARRQTRFPQTGDPTRLAVWALAVLIAVLAALGWFGLGAERHLAIARERLLAGDLVAARVALESVHWPEAAGRKAAGLAILDAASGDATATARRDGLAFFEPEPLLANALRRRALDSAARLAGLERRAGIPLGALYEAALLADRGDLDGARRLAATTAFPLVARGLGRRLLRVLELRANSGSALLLDRNGEPVGTLSDDGLLLPTAEDAPFVEQALARASLLQLSGGVSTGGVRLTLDLELSRLAREALGELRGSIVLIEPATGSVLAAVSDPVTASRDPQAAFDQRREPASIAKLLTTAASYRAQHDADALIRQMKCTGVERYDGKPLWCPSPSGHLAGLDHALAVSCNIVFANLSMLIGRERLLQEYRLWGFDAPPGELLDAAGRIERPPELPRQLADLAIGLESTSVTPLHAAALAAIVANDGRLAAPRLVSGGCGLLGLSDAPLAPLQARQEVPPAVARRLALAMRAVTAYGTAAGLEPLDFAVAMKTGTASLPVLGYHVNYVGFAPAEQPSVAFCVRVTGERSVHRIHRDAREITARLLEALAARRGSLDAHARVQRALAAPSAGETP